MTLHKKTKKTAKKAVKKNVVKAKSRTKKTTAKKDLIKKQPRATTTVTTTVTTTIHPTAGAVPVVPRKTIVSFLIDQSGSMGSTKQATIGGFNEYLQTLKSKGGEVLFTLTKFSDTSTNIVHDGVPLEQVIPLNEYNYSPIGGTPLYDAIGRTIVAIDNKLAGFVGEKPAVLLVIMTDGAENTSREFSREMIFALIKAKEALGWAVTYMGANQDSYAVASTFGIGAGNTVNYHTSNVKGAFAGVAHSHSVYTSSIARGVVVDSQCTLSAADRSVIESKTGSGQVVGDLVTGSVSSVPVDGQTIK